MEEFKKNNSEDFFHGFFKYFKMSNHENVNMFAFSDNSEAYIKLLLNHILD